MATRGASFGIVIAVLILCGCTVYKERPAKSIAEATGGEGLERGFWNEVQGKKWTELEAHMASNFVASTPAGTLDRTGALQWLKGFQLQGYSLGDVQTELNGDTYVITYTLSLRGTRGGQPIPEGPQRVLTVWQEQKRGWVQIAHSLVGPEGK
jgi:ketosteroid isomerase-like protein